MSIRNIFIIGSGAAISSTLARDAYVATFQVPRSRCGVGAVVYVRVSRWCGACERWRRGLG